MPVYLLNEQIAFPSPRLSREDGLLAVGGDLSTERLLLAYRLGIFPWYTEGEPILWWSPDPRLVLYPGEFKPSRSLQKTIRQNLFRISLDAAFNEVINACAQPRKKQGEKTWITADMIKAYCLLHALGFAHSVEAWYEDRLAGGLYGIALGHCFFGESMFTRVRDASKVALATLVRYLSERSFEFIDCQVTTSHFIRLGAREIPRDTFLRQLSRGVEAEGSVGKWSL